MTSKTGERCRILGWRLVEILGVKMLMHLAELQVPFNHLLVTTAHVVSVCHLTFLEPHLNKELQVHTWDVPEHLQ